MTAAENRAGKLGQYQQFSQENSGSAQWHSRRITELLHELETNTERGLSQAEASNRLKRYGPNALRERAAVRPIVVLANQFRSLVIWVLIGAAAVSIALGETVDELAIAVIIFLNFAVRILSRVSGGTRSGGFGASCSATGRAWSGMVIP